MAKVEILMETPEEGVKRSIIRPLEPLIIKCEFDTIITHTAAIKAIGETLDKMSTRDMLALRAPHRNEGIGLLQEDTIYLFCQYDDEDRDTVKEELEEEERYREQKKELLPKVYYEKSGVVTKLIHHPIYTKLCQPVLKFSNLTLELEVERSQREFFEIPIKGIQMNIEFVALGSPETKLGWYNLRTNILWVSDLPHNIHLFPKLFEEVLTKIYELRRFGKFKEPTFNLGADPEFEILSRDNRLLSAGSFYNKEGQIGTDGHIETGELRPDPSRSPLGLVRNIKRLVRKLGKNSSIPEDSKICAGGGIKVNTGGHLHFDNPKVPYKAKETLYDLVGSAVLFHQTGPRNEEHGLIDRDGHDSIRGSNGIGNPKTHKGWEWRSLPSWLVSEDITECVIVTTYCVVKALYAQNIIMKRSKEETLRNLPLYPVYKSYIEDFIEKFYNSERKIKMVMSLAYWSCLEPYHLCR